MKKLALSLPLAIAMGLAGCSGDDTTLQQLNNEAQQGGEMVQPVARIVFDPTGGELSVPNDLLFSGTTDGTLEMPDEVAARAMSATGLADYSDPGQALGALDGWSTQNPFVLSLDFPTGYSLDADSAEAPGAFRLFEVKMGGEVGCESVARGLACAPVAELTFGVDFVTSASGNSLAVAPLKPLKPATTYIMATTKMLKDSAGRAVEGSSTYDLVRQDISQFPLATPSQLSLQAAVNSYEGVIAGLGVDKETVTYTAAMTTQSVGNVLMTVKTIMAANLELNPAATPAVMVQPTGLTVADALVIGGQLTEENPQYMAFAAADWYAGTVNMPYYLSVPTEADKNAPLNTPWKAACDTGVAVQGYAQAAGLPYPYVADPTNPDESFPTYGANDYACMALSQGALRDLTESAIGALDKDRHMTKYNVIPRMNAMQNVDVQMTVPNLAMVNMIRQGLGMSTIEEPEMGFPVVITVHGVGRSKEDMLATVASLNLAGFATVAIDLPLHGSRGFDTDDEKLGDEINATTVTPTDYFNLANLPVTRDNVRQGTSDLMALRLGLNFAQGAPINAAEVHVLGLSLGAINSSNFLAITNTPNLEATLGVPGIDNLFKITSGVLASPGGGLASLLIESPAFGPLVQGGVLAASGTELAAEFVAFMMSEIPECVGFENGSDGKLSCAYQVFGLGLTLAGETEKLAEISATVAQYLFAAQTVTDAADPNNAAAFVAANNSPILLTEIVGDGMENLSDQVVPVQTVNTPFGGTEPLIRALALGQISGTTEGAFDGDVASTIRGAIRFTKGHHGSLLSPDAATGATDAAVNARVTAEMQNQAASFFSSKGTKVVINDAELILGGN